MIQNLYKCAWDNASREEWLWYYGVCIQVNVPSKKPNEDVQEDYSINKYFKHPSKVQYKQCLRTRWYAYCNINWRRPNDRKCIVNMSPNIINLFHNEGKMILGLLRCFAFHKKSCDDLIERDGKTLR